MSRPIQKNNELRITLYIPRSVHKRLRVLVDYEGITRLVWLNPRNVVDLKRRSRTEGCQRIFTYMLTVTDSAKGDGFLRSFEVHEVVNDGHSVKCPGNTTDHLRSYLKRYAAVIDDFEWFSRIHAKGIISCNWPQKDVPAQDVWTHLKNNLEPSRALIA